MAFLIKSTNTYRVSTVDEALMLRAELQNGPGELNSFKYVHKDVKAKGETVDEFELVTATLIFNDPKEPESTIREHYE